jgi:predicted metal-dependent hydrolase
VYILFHNFEEKLLIMSTKLTLTIEDSIINKAKQYAKFKGYSLSKMIENYLKIVASDTNLKNKEIEVSPIVKSLQGSFKAPNGFDYKKELVKALSKKYK